MNSCQQALAPVDGPRCPTLAAMSSLPELAALAGVCLTTVGSSGLWFQSSLSTGGEDALAARRMRGSGGSAAARVLPAARGPPQLDPGITGSNGPLVPR